MMMHCASSMNGAPLSLLPLFTTCSARKHIAIIIIIWNDSTHYRKLKLKHKQIYYSYDGVLCELHGCALDAWIMKVLPVYGCEHFTYYVSKCESSTPECFLAMLHISCFLFAHFYPVFQCIMKCCCALCWDLREIYAHFEGMLWLCK